MTLQTISPSDLRRDLEVAPRWYHGQRWWLVHDPLRNAYHRIPDRDYQALSSGDVAPSLATEAGALGLLRGTRSFVAKSVLSNVLAVRLPGIAMDRWAEWLAHRSGWLMSGPAIVAWVAVMFCALTTVAVRWEPLVGGLPALYEFMGAGNLQVLLIVTAVTKVLHELGHAVACRRQGARVGEIGVLLLCGVPCMFCDVTAAWALPQRFQRAAVMAAGMYVEWILAALATIVWSMTPLGFLNTLCLNVMFVCSVSTLMFNGNPLMRYDGYFILGDVLDSPNLQRTAADGWRRTILSLFGQSRIRLGDVSLSGYHLLASGYRTLVTILLGWWLSQALMEIHLFPIAILVGFACGFAAVFPWWQGLLRWQRGDEVWKCLPKFQRWLVLAVIGVVFFALMVHQRPVRVSSQGTVDVAGATSIFAPARGGQIAKVSAFVGAEVHAGAILVEFRDPELEFECLQQRAKCERLATLLENLQLRSLAEPQLLEHRKTMAESLHAAQRQLDLLGQQVRSLTIMAPHSGRVLPPLTQSMTPSLDQLGMVLNGSEMWCRIGNPQHLLVELDVDRDARRHVGTGAPVYLAADSSPDRIVCCRLTHVSDCVTARESADPVRSSAGQPLDPSKIQIRCNVPSDTLWHPGSQVAGWIEGPREPLYERLLRGAYQMFAP